MPLQHLIYPGCRAWLSCEIRSEFQRGAFLWPGCDHLRFFFGPNPDSIFDQIVVFSSWADRFWWRPVVVSLSFHSAGDESWQLAMARQGSASSLTWNWLPPRELKQAKRAYSAPDIWKRGTRCRKIKPSNPEEQYLRRTSRLHQRCMAIGKSKVSAKDIGKGNPKLVSEPLTLDAFNLEWIKILIVPTFSISPLSLPKACCHKRKHRSTSTRRVLQYWCTALPLLDLAAQW